MNTIFKELDIDLTANANSTYTVATIDPSQLPDGATKFIVSARYTGATATANTTDVDVFTALTQDGLSSANNASKTSSMAYTFATHAADGYIEETVTATVAWCRVDLVVPSGANAGTVSVAITFL